MKEDKGKFEEAVRSKLYDHGSNTEVEDWEKIVAGLPAGKKARLFPLKKYLTVAAAIAALTALVGGLYFFDYRENKEINKRTEARTGECKKTVLAENHTENHTAVSTLNEKKEPTKTQTDENTKTKRNKSAKTALAENHTENQPEILIPDKKDEVGKERTDERENVKTDAKTALAERKEVQTGEVQLIADASRRIKRKRWGFGFGGGRVGVNSNSGGLSGEYMATGNSPQTPQRDFSNSGFLLRESPAVITKNGSNEIPYTDNIKHKTPVSLGLGVNYYLNERWTLQSGLVYTILHSDWSNNKLATETKDYTQKLHYLGIPLSASCRLGQWKHLGFYASAGGMVEYNIAGNLKTVTIYESTRMTAKNTTDVKMKEPLFSVNSRLGITYPVWRFVSVYAETGVSYYFDNKSFIKTVRSDKSFNVSLQAGFSFGF